MLQQVFYRFTACKSILLVNLGRYVKEVGRRSRHQYGI